MSSITIVERSILESLEKRPMGIDEIKTLIEIPSDYLDRFIQKLTIKGLIEVNSNGQFITSKKVDSSVLKTLNSPQTKKDECLEIISTSLYYLNGVSLKKARLTRTEKNILKSMISNIDDFLKDCDKKNKQNILPTIFFWGLEDYSRVIRESL